MPGWCRSKKWHESSVLFYSAALLATPQLPVEAVLDPTLPLGALAPRPHHRAVAREPAPRQREPRQCEQRARRLNLAPLRTARARLAARTARAAQRVAPTGGAPRGERAQLREIGQAQGRARGAGEVGIGSLSPVPVLSARAPAVSGARGGGGAAGWGGARGEERPCEGCGRGISRRSSRTRRSAGSG